MTLVVVLVLCIWIVKWKTCSGLNGSNTATLRAECNFNLYNSAYVYGVLSGPTSMSLYYLYRLYKSPSTYVSVIRK